ncbi:B12-binding domain-containing radical SAM protein [Clostridium oceanicum]|uniref:B12-binding domain-containing radical SAM protein n=1 Tax=Clostridium oceanicum TaxID=1543 RepID=A0ABN1JTR2_9CLOT
MKVVLAAVNSKFIHSNLAVRYLKYYTKDLEYDSIIKEYTINDRKENILESLVCEKADIICFSCYIWNIEYVKAIATLVKLVNPSIKILYGGPEVTYDSKDFLTNTPGEYVIEGEGEQTYREFIEKILKREDVKNIKGLYVKDKEKIYYGGPRENMSMEDIVFPYRDMTELENKIVYYEASRGCPFNCKYCLSSTLHGVRFQKIERVKDEIKFFVDKKVKLIKFVDRTFNCDHKFAKEIWSYIVNLDTNTTFHFEISADLLREDEIEILSKSPKGRIQFEVGVQTTNNKILNNINRYVNFESIKEKVEELEKMKNIKQHLDLIAGLPGENLESFKNSFNDVHSIYPEEIQLGFLKLLKGSSMRYEAEKWGMVYSPYPPYEILKTKDISYDELLILKKVEAVVDKYYNSGKFNNILKYFIPKFKTYFNFYNSLAKFCDEKGYFARNISSSDYYKIFVDFNEEVINEDSESLKEIIKFDYLEYNKKRWIPNFLNREMDKKVKKNLKNQVLKDNHDLSDNIHIEKFFVDIQQFLDTGKIIKKDMYVIFDEKRRNNIVFVKKC